MTLFERTEFSETEWDLLLFPGIVLLVCLRSTSPANCTGFWNLCGIFFSGGLVSSVLEDFVHASLGRVRWIRVGGVVRGDGGYFFFGFLCLQRHSVVG